MQDTVSSFNFIKYFAYRYYTLCIFVRSIYMFSIFQSAFFQISFNTSSKSRYISHILIRKYALTSTTYKFLDIGIVVGSVSHVQIAIDDNRSNHVHSSCYMYDIHREACRYQAINAVPLSYPITSRSKCGTC